MVIHGYPLFLAKRRFSWFPAAEKHVFLTQTSGWLHKNRQRPAMSSTAEDDAWLRWLTWRLGNDTKCGLSWIHKWLNGDYHYEDIMRTLWEYTDTIDVDIQPKPWFYRRKLPFFVAVHSGVHPIRPIHDHTPERLVTSASPWMILDV
jgi:hypothetical protein